jgi:hypothetical protein
MFLHSFGTNFESTFFKDVFLIEIELVPECSNSYPGHLFNCHFELLTDRLTDKFWGSGRRYVPVGALGPLGRGPSAACLLVGCFFGLAFSACLLVFGVFGVFGLVLLCFSCCGFPQGCLNI